MVTWTAVATTAAVNIAAVGPQVLAALLHMPVTVVQVSLLAIHQTVCPARQFTPEIGDQFCIECSATVATICAAACKMKFTVNPVLPVPKHALHKLAHQPLSMTVHAAYCTLCMADQQHALRSENQAALRLAVASQQQTLAQAGNRPASQPTLQAMSPKMPQRPSLRPHLPQPGVRYRHRL